MEPEAFLDWIAGEAENDDLLASLRGWEAREVRRFLDQLREQLTRHLPPVPPKLDLR